MTDIALRILLQAQNQASSVISSVTSDLMKLGGGDASVLATVGGVALAAGAAIVGVGIAVGVVSTKMAADFQQSMLKVQALTGLTAQQTQQMSNAILDMATNVGEAPKDLADGLYFVASAGFRGQDALNILQLSAESAKIGMTDTKTVADALTSALNAFGLKGKDARTVMDEMTATVTAGKMEWQNYANVVGKLSVIAKASGISFNEANAALADLTNSGYSARLASTSLGNLFTQLELKTDSLAKNAKKLHVAFDETKFKSMSLAQQIQYLNQVTGGHQDKLLKLMNSNSTALKTFDALSNSLGAYKNNLASINNAHKGAGTTAQAWAITQQGLNVQMDKAKAALNVMFITIGNKLLPIVTNLMSQIVPLIGQFTTWITKSGVLDDIIAGLSIYLKGLQMIFQFLKPYIMEAIQAIIKFGRELWERIAPIVAGITAWIHDHMTAIVDILKGVWGVIVGIIQVAWAIITGIFKIGLDFISGNWGQMWTDLKDMLKGIWDGMITMLKGQINVVIGLINGMITDLNKIGIDIGPIHIHPHIPTIPTLATGGYITGGGLALLHPGEQVVPASVVRGSGGSSGGATIINVHVHAGLMTDRRQMQQLGDIAAKAIADKWRGQANIQVATSGSVRS